MAQDQFDELPLKLNFHASVVVTRCEKHVEEIGRSRLLRQQISALHDVIKASSNFDQKHIALVSMPTGSGKTGVIACLPYYLGNIKSPESGEPRYLFDKPILVIAPNVAILSQLKQELTVADDSKPPFLTRTGIVLPKYQKKVLPYSLIIETTSEVGNKQRLKAREIVIANAQKFLAGKWEQNLPDDLFRLVIVDEAHHHPAPTWRRIVEKFRSPDCPVFFFTATPYRTDGKRVLPPDVSCIAHHLPLNKAVNEGIIRQTHFEALRELHPDETFLRDPETLAEEVRANMRRMIPILDRVKELLDQKRDFTRSVIPEVPHMAIAITKDVDYANKLLKLWEVFYPQEPAESYYSQKSSNEKAEIMRKLKNNELSLVIVVAMLLEGFDHPPISIAAITCKIQSLVRFVQFVGRAQRVYRRDGYTEDRDLRANIVTHEHYDQQTNYDDFIAEKLIPTTDEENVDEY